MTGVLDRLQRDGWIVRERAPEAADRRAVTVRAVPGRTAEVFRAYAGMNSALDRLCADHTEEELTLLAGFPRRVAEAGSAAADELAGR